MAEVQKPQDENEEAAPETEVESDETPEGASDVEQDATPDEQPEVEASEGEDEPAEPVAEAPEPETEPFGFTADGRRFEVPGAALVRYKEGDQTIEKIVMDREAFHRYVQPKLRDQAALQKRDVEHKRELAARDPERHEDTVRARSLLESMEQVLTSEETVTAFLQNFQRDKELWSLRAEAAVQKARLTGYTSAETEQQTQAQSEQTASNIAEELPDIVTGIAQQFGISDQRALGAAYQQISRNIGAYYRYATAQDAQNYGVTQGEIIRDDDAVADTIQRFAQLTAQDQKVAQVKKTNQAALGAGKAAPKTVSAKGSPGAAEKPRTFKNKEDWIRHMGGNA